MPATRVPRARVSECARSIAYAAAPPPTTRTTRTATRTVAQRLLFTLNTYPRTKITQLKRGLVRVDSHRQAGERLAPRRGDEPRVLHVDARAAVRPDRVRVHREDHVLAQLGLDALADLRVLDHRHADRVAGDVAEVVATRPEAARDGRVDVVRARAGTHRLARGLEVLDVGLEHALLLGAGPAERARDLDPVAARAGDLERGDAEVAEDGVRPGDRELRPDVDHV